MATERSGRCPHPRCRLRLWTVRLAPGPDGRGLSSNRGRCEKRTGGRLQCLVCPCGTGCSCPSQGAGAGSAERPGALRSGAVGRCDGAHRSRRRGNAKPLPGPDARHHHQEGTTGFIDEHVRDGYNRDDIRDKLLRAGFSEVEVAYTYGRPGSLAWKLSMKFPILMLNASKVFFIVLPFYYLLAWPIACCLNYADLRQTHASGTGLLVKARR